MNVPWTNFARSSRGAKNGASTKPKTTTQPKDLNRSECKAYTMINIEMHHEVAMREVVNPKFLVELAGIFGLTSISVSEHIETHTYTLLVTWTQNTQH